MDFNFKIATKVVVSYKAKDEDGNEVNHSLIVGGVTYEYGVGFKKNENIPATINVSNFAGWIEGGFDSLLESLPASIGGKVKTKLEELQTANSILTLDSLNFDVGSMEFEFDIKIPGVSVSTEELGLPKLNGLTFGLEDIWLNVKRKVTNVEGGDGEGN